MGRQVLALTVDRLSLIVDPCATCTYLGAHAGAECAAFVERRRD